MGDSNVKLFHQASGIYFIAGATPGRATDEFDLISKILQMLRVCDLNLKKKPDNRQCHFSLI